MTGTVRVVFAIEGPKSGTVNVKLELLRGGSPVALPGLIPNTAIPGGTVQSATGTISGIPMAAAGYTLVVVDWNTFATNLTIDDDLKIRVTPQPTGVGNDSAEFDVANTDGSPSGIGYSANVSVNGADATFAAKSHVHPDPNNPLIVTGFDTRATAANNLQLKFTMTNAVGYADLAATGLTFTAGVVEYAATDSLMRTNEMAPSGNVVTIQSSNLPSSQQGNRKNLPVHIHGPLAIPSVYPATVEFTLEFIDIDSTVITRTLTITVEQVGVLGFTWLRDEMFTAGSATHTVQIYRNDAFATALGLGSAPATDVACEFVLIPSRVFVMGSEIGGEIPVHRVKISAFLMARTETTQLVWQNLVGATGLPATPSSYIGNSRPVETVSWSEVSTWCSANTLRMPSESEWEYACRATTSTEYYFSDSNLNLPLYAWYAANSGGTTQPVGMKQTNAFGLFDMSGNVFEWCQDDYASNYDGAPTDGSARFIPGAEYRVFRGGSWDYPAGNCRSASRPANFPGWRASVVGFRPVQALSN